MASQQTPSSLPPNVEHMLALDELPLGRLRVGPAEVEAIRNVLAEGPPAATRVDLARAMFIAADNAPDEQTARLIANILNDRNADASLRLQAAAVLGDVPVPAASKALAEALAGSTPWIEATLLKSLAKVGDAEAERMIGARPNARSPRLARLRDFARAAILYRTGAGADERAERAILPVGEVIAVTHEPPSKVEAALGRLRGSTYGLRFNPELGYGFQCGGTRHLVLLSSELKRGALLAALGATRRIAGIVAMEDGSDSAASYVARHLIVARPAPDGIDVSVVGTDGDVQLLGGLRRDGKGLALTLRTHGTALPPTAVDGAVTDDGLLLEVRVFIGGPSVKLHGEVDPAAS